MGTNRLGDTLRAARKARELTQAQLATKAGVAQGTIGNIESGLRGYGESLVNIARALGVSPEHLRCEPERPGSARVAGPQLAPHEEPPTNEASADEIIELINAYKNASAKDRAQIMASAKVAAKRAARRHPPKNQGQGGG